ncbi:response regulator [Haloterrigena sp. SYSU A121-1]|uniref:Response regulator n=1 Tax=Haloterrigena gelatinilytica TaxID=2741724 RepID=A0A8J8KF25_9EURY|nr:response regulator [Haloterrigena gelatinilytica]NUB91151.1 response regulator [Haloterrigena gelatinilytica]
MTGVDILLVEDNDGDVRLVERAFKTRELPGTLHVVQTGDRALDWLHQRGEFAERPYPDLVLLDLNLPAISGEAILEEIQSGSHLQRIPVVVLTSSQADDDLVMAYEAGANAFLRKSVDPEEFTDIIQSFTEFWVSTADLPPNPDDGEVPQQNEDDT